MVISDGEARRVAEVQCRSVLNKSGLADYAVNCYAGCEYGCLYCYARFATRFSHTEVIACLFPKGGGSRPEFVMA